MSKIDDMIREMCPDGVEYRPLGEVCDFLRGKGLSKADKRDNGTSIILYGELYTVYGNYIDEIASQTEFEKAQNSTLLQKGDIIMPISSTTKEAQIGKASVICMDGPIYLGGDALCLRHKQIPGFLMYLLNGSWFEQEKMKYVRGTTIMHLSPDGIKKIEIPVPPLEIQKEIVRVLDNFTEYSTELQSELQARIKQYEYYRDKLLSFDNLTSEGGQVEWLALGDFATITRGGNFQKKDLVDKGYPCIHYGQMYTHYKTWAENTISFVNEDTYVKSKKANPGDIIMAVTSENLDDVCKSIAWLGSKPTAISAHAAIISHNQSAKYLSYYFQTKDFFRQKRKLAHGTKVIEVTPAHLAKVKIPVPSRKIQERIVYVLDNFETVCNDLKIGLPAEIETRQNQYEYYRDKLLSFDTTVDSGTERERERERED